MLSLNARHKIGVGQSWSEFPHKSEILHTPKRNAVRITGSEYEIP